jgi:predicted outer membrane repeat protein
MRFFLLFLPAFFLTLCVPTLQAYTWYVPSDCPTIQACIDSASVGDTVLVATGTYYEHDIVMKSGISLIGAAGDPDSVIIDAELSGRGIVATGVSSSTLIEGLTIYHGYAPLPLGHGGGILCDDGGSPKLLNLIIRNCTAVTAGNSGGGGIYFSSTTSALVIDCKFEGNSCLTCGGAVYCESYASPTFDNCSFNGNYANDNSSYDAYGGAVGLSGNCSPSFTNCHFEDNWSNLYAGAFFAYSSCIANLDGCSFINNVAGRVFGTGVGGGIHWKSGSSGTITNSYFLNNQGKSGGAISLQGHSDAEITNCIFDGNMAETVHGGAIYSTEGSNPTISWCIFENNSADSSHGGAVACGSLGQADISNCTIAGNSASRGGAISALHTGENLLLSNCILAFNSGAEAVFCDSADQVTFECSDIFGNSGGDWIGCIADQADTNGNFSADPMFCGIQNPDSVYALCTASPCASNHSPDGCGLIGAVGVGCNISFKNREQIYWGYLKALFRK